MLVFDGHLDLAWNALQWNRDIQQSVHTLRVQEAGLSGKGRGQNTVALPEMRRGSVHLCFATTLARSTPLQVPHVDFHSPAQAFASAQGQLAWYQAMERLGELVIITCLEQLDSHVLAWERHLVGDQPESPPPGLIPCMESADPILEPEDLDSWQAAGIRLIGPAHYGMGRYAGGTGVEEGLTDRGRRLLREMEGHGVMLDLTHLSDASFWQALELYHGPVLASHSNCRALVPHQRQFSDAQLVAIIARDGVIGAALDAWMLVPGWIKGARSNRRATLSMIVDHVDHVCQLAGNSRHAALGSDLDGGFGREQSPADLDTIADLRKIATLLEGRGYSSDDVAAVMHGNWTRLLRKAWGAR
ncbi:MAG: membrane dipeptidase [Anaerolineaceae bacterium]|nr:membrane dipeptidase [Anaerolineaceae bacterium]